MKKTVRLRCLVLLLFTFLLLFFAWSRVRTNLIYFVDSIIDPPNVNTEIHRPLTSRKFSILYTAITKGGFDPTQTQAFWKWISPFVKSGPWNDAQLIVTPSLVANGDEVTVHWESLPWKLHSVNMDWIGLYCPADAPHTRPVDFWWAKELISIPSYSGSAKFTLYNVRTTCQFRYFYNDTGSKLVAVSNTVQFENSLDAHLHIHLALTDSPSEMRVQWTTGRDCVPTVHYGTFPVYLSLTATGVSTTYKASDMCGPPANMSAYFIQPGYLHDVLLTELTPNTQYYYQVSGTGVSSEMMSFRTPPLLGSDTPLSFIIYGDMDITPFSDQTAASVLRDIEQGSSFVLHVGDLSYATGLAYRWDEWMTLIEPLSSRVPYMVSIGNHDQCYKGESKEDPSIATSYPQWCTFHDSGGECGVPVSKRFHMPDNGHGVWWYSLKYGLVHIIQLSTEHSLSPGSAQYAWLERELESVDREITPWLIVTGHRPIYTSQTQEVYEYNTSIHLREDIEELLYTYQVDLYVAGHFHLYERTSSVYEGKRSSNGTVHIIVGTAGTYLDDGIRMRSDWLKYLELSSYGYGRVAVSNKTSLLWEFVTVDGRVMDFVWLLK